MSASVWGGGVVCLREIETMRLWYSTVGGMDNVKSHYKRSCVSSVGPPLQVDGPGTGDQRRPARSGGCWIGDTWFGLRSWSGSVIEAPPPPKARELTPEELEVLKRAEAPGIWCQGHGSVSIPMHVPSGGTDKRPGGIQHSTAPGAG